MVKGFFFDLDGTLVDTHQANFEAYRRAVQEVSGAELTFEQFTRSIGNVAKTFLPWFAPGLQEADYQRMANLKAHYYKDLMHLTRLNAELVDFMHSMKNVQMVLVTAAKRVNAQAVLAHHGISDAFAYIITAEDVEHSKPAPDAYILALKRTGLQADEALAFEDSETGIRAAEAAGIRVVPVNNFAV